MKILVLNCGSSTVKYQLIDMSTEQSLADGVVERIGSDTAGHRHRVAAGVRPELTEASEVREVASILDHGAAIRRVMGMLVHPAHGVIGAAGEIGAVGHRVVHGGEALTQSVRLTPDVKRAIRDLFPLAPLHNPAHMKGIEAAEEQVPGVPQVLVFDTAFHATMPRTAFLYALPYAIYKRHRVRRYGFHGTSHYYVSRRLGALLDNPDLTGLKVVSCHLGQGSSACAIVDGRSVDTSMGFTPLEGLVMGTRCGDLDPGALAYIMDREELTASELNSMLNKHSGIQGISGVTSDFRQLEEEMATNPRAREAFDIFAYRLRKYIGAYAAAMGGVDAIIFTGGIGAGSWRLRAEVCQHLGFLGLSALEAPANCEGHGERRISAVESALQVWVIPTNEELVIAREAARLVG